MQTNSYQLLHDIMHGVSNKRKLASLILSLHGAQFVNNTITEYYTKPDIFCEGQFKMIDFYDLDIVYSPFVLCFQAEMFGSELAFLPKNTPYIKRTAIDNFSQFKLLKLPDFTKCARHDFILQSTEKLSAQIKKHKPLGAILLSPADLPALFMGLEGWVETLIKHTNIASEILEFTTNYTLEWAKLLLNAGADFLLMPLTFCNPALVPEEITETLYSRLHKEFFKLNCPIILHHGGAKINPVLDLYKNLPNVIGFIVDQRDDIAKSRTLMKENQILIGNIYGPGIKNKKVNELQRECNLYLKSDYAQKYFILGTSGADIAYDTPRENIQAIFNAIRCTEAKKI